MGISILNPAATASGGSQDGFSFTAADAGFQYETVNSFSAGVYTISTSPTANQVEVIFFSASQVSSAALTVSGTITYALAFDATGCFIRVVSGSNTQVTIDQIANSLTGAAINVSGTLDTISNTQTYNQTGLLYVVAISGGTGGGGGATVGFPHTNDRNGGGVGGHGGNFGAGFVYSNTAQTITVGAGGNGGANTATGGTSGESSFGNLVLSGQATHNSNNQDGAGGSFATGASGGMYNLNAGAVTNNFKSATTGTYGGGGRGMSNVQNAQNGAGSGIGTGGAGSSNSNLAGSAATGFGSGGGGGKNNGTNTGTSGGAGSPGVVYVLRGF